MIVWRKGDRIISIDEYIEYLEKCADLTKGSEGGDRLSRQHAQLAEWLRELKSMRQLYNDLADICEGLYVDNVRYKSCLIDDGENARQILGEYDELKNLAGTLVKMMDGVGNCHYCPHFLECDLSIGSFEDECQLVGDLRRFGVEVG